MRIELPKHARLQHLGWIVAAVLMLNTCEAIAGTPSDQSQPLVDTVQCPIEQAWRFSTLSDGRAGSPTVPASVTVPSRSSLVGDFRGDISTIGTDPLFYGLTFTLFAGAKLLKNENPELNESWAVSTGADHLFEAGDMMGNGIFPLTAAACGYGYGKFFNHPSAASFASDLFRAQVLNGIATLALKRSIGRRRPDGSAWSYPSGHTSSSFATAAVINNHFGLKFGVPAFALASYVGLSRLQENRHYLSDVIAGAALGIYFGFKTSRHRTHGSNSMAVGLTGSGVSLTWSF